MNARTAKCLIHLIRTAPYRTPLRRYLGSLVLPDYARPERYGEETGAMWKMMLMMVIAAFLYGYLWHPGM